MIEQMIPLTKNKIEILRQIYIEGQTHLLDIAKKLRLHPYSVQKTLQALEPFLEKKKHGKTITLSIRPIEELLYIIEDYRVGSCNKKIKPLIKNIQMFFSGNKNIMTCCLFGSYARDASTEESDVDLLFVVRAEDDSILHQCRDISGLLGKEINPLIMKEKEFFSALINREPAIESIIVPSQRLILVGKEYFLRH